MFCVSISDFKAYAEYNTEKFAVDYESKQFNAGKYETSEEQFNRFVNSDYATPEKIAAYKQIMEEHEAISSGANPETRASSRILGVPFYEQKNSYYCGPATVRQVRAYLVGTGGLPGQDVIASALGTTVNGTEQSRIVDYLNNYCSGTYESLWKNGAYTSASTLFNHIIADITNNKPTVAHIYDTSASYWRYTTNGHYLCFEGYADDTTTNGHVIYVVDPWLNGHHIINGKYTVSRETAYAVTDRIAS